MDVLPGPLRPVLLELAAGTTTATGAGACAVLALHRTALLAVRPHPDRVAPVLAWWAAAALLGALGQLLAHDAEARCATDLRHAVAARLVRLRPTLLADLPTARRRALVGEDVQALHHLVAHLPGDVAATVVVPVTAVALLVRDAGPGALAALAPAALAALCHLWWVPRASARHGATRARALADVAAAVDDQVRGAQTLRLYGAPAGPGSFAAATGRFTTDMLTWVGAVAVPAALAAALLQPAPTLALAGAAATHLPLRGTAVLLLLGPALLAPAARLGHGLDHVPTGLAAARRLHALLRTPLPPPGRLPAPTRPTGPGPDTLHPSPAQGLVATGVAVQVHGRRLLHDVHLQVPPGRLAVVTGPSGAGKSTLLRVLAGLEPPTSGTVHLHGAALHDVHEDALPRAVLLVPQDTGPRPGTVRDDLHLAAPDVDDARLRPALARAGLATITPERPGRTLSGGERARVALARTVLSGAGCVLLDEPTAALDPPAARHVVEVVGALAHDEGRAVVVATHDPRLVAVADVHLHLVDGRAGPPPPASAPCAATGTDGTPDPRGRR